MQSLAIMLIVIGGFVLRQVFLGRGTDLPTDARDLFVAVGNGDWSAASEVTARRSTAPDSGAVTGTDGGSGDPTVGASSNAKGYAWQAAQLKAKFGNNVVITSTTGGTHATNSYHYKGEAVDIDTRNGLTKREVFDWLSSRYGGSAELIYTPAGGSQLKNGKTVGNSGTYAAVATQHNDHVHWAYAGPWS